MCDVSDRVDGVLCARHGDGDREIVYDRDGCTAKRGPIVCADGRTGKPVRQWTYARPGKDHLQRATLGDFDASRPGLELAAVGKKEGMGGLILWSRAGRPAWRKDIPAGWVTCGVRVGLCDHIGCGRDELMRVLGPRGALCVHESGRWAKTVRPRPKGMDDWTHPHHGPDGNMVSRDRMLRFPIGLRWIGGLPKSIDSFASVRGWVLANGRCHIVSSSVVDNLAPGIREKTHYLICRDAFNGLPLWKIHLGIAESGSRLHWRNTSPLAEDDQRVYAVGKGKALIADSSRVFVDDNDVVSANLR